MTRVSLAAAFLATGFVSAASACDECQKKAPTTQSAAPTNGIGAFDVPVPADQPTTYERSRFHGPAVNIGGRQGRGYNGHGLAECVDGHCADAAGCTDIGCGHSHDAPHVSRYPSSYSDQFRRPTAIGGRQSSSYGTLGDRHFHLNMSSEVAPPPTFGDNPVPSPFYGTAAAASVCPIDGRSIETAESPVRVAVSGRLIWLCCEACAAELRREPMRYLGESHVSFAPQPATPADAAAIFKQMICPVTRQRLDPSGDVWKVWFSGRPMFVCCRDCVGRLTEMARREHGMTSR